MPYRPPFWRLALAGVIAGAALYFFPFLLPAAGFILLLGLIFRLVLGSGRGFGPWRRHAFATRWAAMSEEERIRFREQWAAHRCGRPWKGQEQATAPKP
jgi:hypothetical protein